MGVASEKILKPTKICPPVGSWDPAQPSHLEGILSTERVKNHWQEDLMFGYQFLNGCNPVLIKRCTALPPKLPVTTEMVECSLERQLSLEQEVQVGRLAENLVFPQ